MGLIERFVRWLGIQPIPEVRIGRRRGGGHAIKAGGFGRACKGAEKRGREDALSGQHTIYSNAAEPAEVTRLRAAEAGNAAGAGVDVEALVLLARGAEAAAEVELSDAIAAQSAAAESLLRAEEHRASLSEERFGFAAIPAWAAWTAGVSLLLGDIFFTWIALAQSVNVADWETLILAATIGALLFAVGIGKAYIDVVDFRGEASRGPRPWPSRSKKVLSRLLLWTAGLTILTLLVTRINIVRLTTPKGRVPWQHLTGSFAGFLVVGFAAALVAVVAYLGAYISFVSRPISKARAAEKAARRAVKAAAKRHNRADRALTTARASVAQAEALVQETPDAVRAAWGQVRAAYWRGFALHRPEEQPPLRPLPTEPEAQ